MQVTIIGAGVIGLSLAWELSQRGAYVQIVERGASGQETSWAAAGILPAARRDTASDLLEQLRGLSHELYPQWTGQLRKITGIDPGFRHCGGIYLASSVGEAASLQASLSDQHNLQITALPLTAKQLVSEEPALAAWAQSKGFKTAVLFPDECQIRPPDLLVSLAVACRAAGVKIQEHCTAELVLQSKIAELHIQDASGNKYLHQSERIIVCGGAWSGQIAAACGLTNSIVPIRGQMLLYQFADPPLRRIINEGHRYLVPRDDGKLLVGSCEEEVGFRIGTTANMLESLARWAESILPRMFGMSPVRTWSALRPATIDGFPLLGKVPDFDNLYFASGHYRSGVHLAPATATVMADLLYGTRALVDITAFDVGRMVSQT